MSIYFAIVIVTYNRKNYLEKTLKSINDLLKTASKNQLGLIYDTISNILDLTNIEK